MADVTNDVDMETAADERLKRVFGDITNGEKKTKKTKKKKPKKEPPKKYTVNWSATERARKEAPSDATKLSDACRQPYGVVTPIQETHAPKIKPSAAFHEHEGADAVKALQARKSGAAPSAPAGRLAKRPLWGGISSRKNAPAPPANIVGVHEKCAAASKKGLERQARQKQGRGKGGPRATKGSTFAPQFRLWRDDQEGPEAAPWYASYKDAVADCKKRWPNVAKTHPDYATTKMTQDLAQVMQGKSVNTFEASKQAGLKRARDITKWKLAWKEE